MKTRQGFVSNSSSSSFVIICSEKMYNDALKGCSEYGESVIKHELPIRQAEKIKLDDKNYLMFHGTRSTDDFACDVPWPDDKEEDEMWEEAEEQWNGFGDRIAKLGGVYSENM